MRILYIITQADGGGAQNYVLTLAKHFGGAIAAGNEASKLFDDARNLPATPAGGQLTSYNLRHLKRNLNPYHDFLAVWEIRRLIKKYHPDIVHLNSTKAGILGSFASIGTKTKVIFTAHGFIFNEPMGLSKKNFYLALEKTASDFRDFIITVSDADKQSALDNKIISAKKIATVHNGIGHIEFLDKLPARRFLGLSDDKIVIGCLSNFYPTKGLDVLIDAASRLDEKLKSRIELILFGSGPEFKNLKLEIRNLQLEKIVKILGNIDNAKKYLRAFDCFVLPSRKEGLPFALLEAMRAGLPIIATNVGGIPETLGEAGVLVPSEQPEQLAEAITSLINDEAKRKDLSQKSRERSKLFTEEQMLGETEKVYGELLDKYQI